MADKKLFIAEKPSVAEEFARVLGESLSKKDGYREGANTIVTWCFGHLVTMSMPDAYDEKYRKWRLDTLPFLPDKYRYEVIAQGSSRKQFATVKALLNRSDVSVIYVCTDSGREGEYIYRLVRNMANVRGKEELRVWINSQTEDEIKRGIDEALPLSEYDNLSSAAYLRAKEDYLMGINFSRLLSIKYGNTMARFLGKRFCVVAVGRVMTCVLGMVVRREQEIRAFKKTFFYRVMAKAGSGSKSIECEWRADQGSRYENSPKLYKENGFKKEEDAKALIEELSGKEAFVSSISRRQEKKNAPLLYNLAELQNDCSRLFKISPDETLNIVQELYEKKLVTYPRTDARVLSSAIAGEISANIRGLAGLSDLAPFANGILRSGSYRSIAKTRYVNDSAITDHYAIIPTGKGLSALKSLASLKLKVYEIIARRFLAIFLSPAIYKKASLVVDIGGERFFASDRYLVETGYLAVMQYSFTKEKKENTSSALDGFKKGERLDVEDMYIKTGETTPPKRYTTGSIILAMENAGNLIEDETLREEIKGSGIGTSATRADILEKLIKNDYLLKNSKTQVLTPSLQGEMIYYVVGKSISSMLNPELTAGWERGLGYVAGGEVSEDEYMQKLDAYIRKWTARVMQENKEDELLKCFSVVKGYHANDIKNKGTRRGTSKRRRANKGGSKKGK